MVAPQQADMIIIPRWIIPIVPETVLENHALVITAGKIVALLPEDDACKRFHAQAILRLDEQVVLPGLINSHTHSPMALLRGLADDLQLMDWLQNHIWPAESQLLSPDFCYQGSQLAMAEMIKGGITCFNDHYFFPEQIAQAVIETGMRAAIGMCILEAPMAFAPRLEDYFTATEQFYKNTHDQPLITTTLAPHSPYMLTDEPLLKIKALSDTHDLLIHMHVNEPDDEIAQSLEKYGKRPIQRLHDLGLLNSKLIAAHMLNLNAEDLQQLKDSGVNVAHCPKANQKLANHFCDVEKINKAGLNVALGTDGPASNNAIDLFSEMQFAALQAKGISHDPTTLPAFEVLKMATINGAKALRLDDQIGSLEVGKSADMIAVDLNVLSSQPVYHPVSQLVYACNRNQVTHVWVQGKLLLKQRELTTLDEKNLLAQAKFWAKKISATQ